MIFCTYNDKYSVSMEVGLLVCIRQTGRWQEFHIRAFKLGRSTFGIECGSNVLLC